MSVSGPARAFADAFAEALEEMAKQLEDESYALRFTLGDIEWAAREMRVQTLRAVAAACRKAASG